MLKTPLHTNTSYQQLHLPQHLTVISFKKWRKFQERTISSAVSIRPVLKIQSIHCRDVNYRSLLPFEVKMTGYYYFRSIKNCFVFVKFNVSLHVVAV